MDQNSAEHLVNPVRGSETVTSKRIGTLKIYGLAAVEFWIATDAVVAAIHLGTSGMSNWFIFPLVLAAFLLAASATYAIAYHRFSAAIRLAEGRLTLAGGKSQE